MTSEQRLERAANNRSDEGNKEMYDNRSNFQREIKASLTSMKPEEITPAFLRDMADKIDRLEKEKDSIMGVSEERAKGFNDKLNEAKGRADESMKTARADQYEVDRIRREIQGIDAEKEVAA